MLHLNLDIIQWMLVICSGLLVGFSKTGINGTATLAIPIMAGVFGGKTSAAMMLPMLIIGDMFGVGKYHNHTQWNYIWRLIPWTAGGLALGLWLGQRVDDHQFKMIIAGSVLICLGIMVWMEMSKGETLIPNQWWFSALIGLAGGFTTMIGNAAGPVMTIYLLSMQLPKYHFIGTSAWFFAMLNLAKLPLQIIFWGSITGTTLLFNTILIPFIALGAFLGVKAIKYLPEKPFRWIILALAGISALRLLL